MPGSENIKPCFFLINRSDLNDRIDPIYYNSVNNLTLTNKTIHPVKKLGEVVTLQRGRFGHRPRNDPDYYGGEYPFIQTGNVVEASRSNERIKYSQTLNELGLSTSRLFQPNVLLITIAANIGDTAILDYAACFPDSLVALIPKTNINIDYLNYYLKYLKTYIESLAPQSAQKNINNQQLSPIPVVVPPIEVQEKIVQVFTTAYSQKQQKEALANELFASIDTYILRELGVTLPVKETNLENRIFTTNYSEVLGRRIDPFSLQKHNLDIKNPKSIYANKRIKEIAVEIKTGFPVRKDFRVIGGQYPYYGANGIIGYMNEFTHNGIYLVIGQDGYIGNHYVVNGKFWGSNHNWVMKLKNGYNYEFIKAALDVLNYDYLITGGVIPKLTKASLESIQIPIPPIEKQNEIANHINEIHNQINKLRFDAREILEIAKIEAEKLIIGN